ncbi:chemotaxis regulatory protein ChePep isoform X2 [Phlebotomus papatasi]|uniref:chemotaxis regulatory protein ChePep isoform X2 n=1 Tax=Phlebotomus papatasi TaxID=29031 RepID=UPI00248431C1|nr:chemotaxis regulatory protein ChePep isoform X2 [Phlebotomus papatasi]
MPSQRHRITSKSQPKQEVEKIKVKTEPIDILPLSEYVDDRVELIKQAFQCLNPKAIKKIAPDFLQSKPIEKIQEQCLNEVLGMSKKRLLSIINATKCPTDTESSSDEEAVKAVVEHISLDEISSEDERSKTASKKKHKKTEKKAEEKPPEKKEYSVLELLELQARARAIRSQLALEPVTKIEIKESDEEEDEEQPPQIKPSQPASSAPQAPPKSSISTNTNNPGKSSGSKKAPKLKSVVSEVNKPDKSNEKAKESNKNGLEKERSTEDSRKSSERRIKLKRNWRRRSGDGENNTIDGHANIVIEVKNTKQTTQVQPEPERSPSPDVLPIVASPETLCISSDTDEEVPAPEKVTEKNSKEDQVTPAKEPSPQKEIPEEPPRDDTPEEGEVLDELEIMIREDYKNLEETAQEKSPQRGENKKEPEEEIDRTNTEQEMEKPTVEEEKVATEEDRTDDDLNDDCIEIVCTDILEENPEQKEESDTQNKTEPEDEILELNDSSDEDDLPLSQLIGEKGSPSKSKNSKIESWNSRWLESSRVSKIMATSRLGNSVRRKIKTKSKKQKETEENESNSAAEEVPVKVTESSVEVGSVEHFHELAAVAADLRSK